LHVGVEAEEEVARLGPAVGVAAFEPFERGAQRGTLGVEETDEGVETLAGLRAGEEKVEHVHQGRADDDAALAADDAEVELFCGGRGFHEGLAQAVEALRGREDGPGAAALGALFMEERRFVVGEVADLEDAASGLAERVYGDFAFIGEGEEPDLCDGVGVFEFAGERVLAAGDLFDEEADVLQGGAQRHGFALPIDYGAVMLRIHLQALADKNHPNVRSR